MAKCSWTALDLTFNHLVSWKSWSIDIPWNTETSRREQNSMWNWCSLKGSMVMLEIREMRNVQRWNSKLNLDNVEMFNIETGQWLMPDSSCCISPDLQCCTTLCLGWAGLHIELAGLGQNWLDYVRIGWIRSELVILGQNWQQWKRQQRNRPKVRLLLL